jgi:hypothetical protein
VKLGVSIRTGDSKYFIMLLILCVGTLGLFTVPLTGIGILATKQDGKRVLGITRHRNKDNIKINLKRDEVEECGLN